MKKELKKIVGTILVVSLMVPTIFFSHQPNQVHAQPFVPVYDIINSALFFTTNLYTLQTAIATGAITVKEVGVLPGLNPAALAIQGPAGAIPAVTSTDFWARTIANILINTIVNQVVAWIDSGFQGSPGFVRDPAEFFLNIADSVAGDFIDGTELGFLCDPFELDIRFSLNYQYSSTFEERITCRLTDIIQNVQDFANFAGDYQSGVSADFYQGGWSGWASLTRQNQYSSYIEAQAELSAQIAGRNFEENLKLDWGSGFLSFQGDCIDPPGAAPENCVVPGLVKTPGTIIADGVSQVVGSDLDDFQLADGFDRILNALLNQLINQALGQTGLLQ